MMKLHRQRPLKTGRIPTLGCLDPAIRKWVEAQSRIDGVYLSFTLNNALSFVSGIALEGKLPTEKVRKSAPLRMLRRA